MASFLGSVIRRTVGAGLLAGVCAWGQAGPAPQRPATLVEPPTPLLQAQVGHWAVDNARTGKAAELSGTDFGEDCRIEPQPQTAATPGTDQCLPLLKEDGLQRFATGQYQQGARLREVHAMQFVDATGAFAAFTYFRSHFAHPQRLVSNYQTAQASVSSGKETLLWAGTVVLLSEQDLSKAEIDEVVAGLPKVGGGKGLSPLLPTLLPATGFSPDSLRYALGPVGYQAMGGVLPAGILGWDKSAESATATYTGRGDSRGTLTLLMYPTPQIAGDRGRAIEQSVNEIGPTKFGTLRMRRIGPMIGVVSGAWSVPQADKTIASLSLNQEVTFDKKKPLEFHAEVRKTASLLQNIAVLCGVLILAAVMLGLFLGFGRAGIRVLMGKPAASEPEFLTINLRDRPKALFAAPDDTPR